MYQPPLFREERPEVLHALLRSHPLALLIVVAGDGEAYANTIPLLFDPDASEKGTLFGHMARANPQWKMLAEAGRALAVFQGPQAYVTPSWYVTKQETGKVVPTWNYAMVQVRGTVRIHEDAGWLRQHVGKLTASHEETRVNPWTVEDAPEAFIQSQLKGIVGLEVEIAGIEGKWKVSQNRPTVDRHGVDAGFTQQGDDAMAGLVKEYGGLE